jgi:two-component system, NtrC family, response regulator AtoC
VAQVRDMAQNPKTTVLLMGETGTGKEFLDRVIRHNRARAEGSSVRINCTTIAPPGTLYLDEVGEPDLAMQGIRLGILQDRSLRRMKRTEDILGELRVIASLCRDFKQEVSAERFRDDLYSRLNGVV